MMDDPSSFTDEENWRGGFYELAMEFAGTADGPLLKGLEVIRDAATLDGFHTARDREPAGQVPYALESGLPTGHLYGLTRPPAGRTCVCGALVSRFDDGTSWLIFYLPLEALGRTDRRVGAFPFNEDDEPSSLAWRRPLDDWLVSLARRVYGVVRFRRALVGFETYGEETEQTPGAVPERRSCGYLLPREETLDYWPATD
ncbi:hypothetical protein GCM10010466_09040 [Planomonospora alba]|uniref:Uncharacterized protein n=1 Tax=Planomonospora alba TaxID=161354 RepID=A0ABP6MNB8_9ACTN